MTERPDPTGPTRRERYELLVAANLAQENAFEILALISRSKDRDEAAGRLRERYSLSPEQTELILTTPYKSMTQHDRARIREELDALRSELDAE